MNLEKILQEDKRIWDGEILDYPQLFELARKYDKDLLSTLFNNKDSKEKFFIQVGDSHVFKYNQFRFYLEENQVNNSFTQYANKIGLASQGEHLSDSTDYVLDWPYKDCVLEGGMSSEEDMDTFIEKKVETTPGKIDKKTGTVVSIEKTEVTFSQAKRKREEIFYNNIIADKEIDRLLDKKALKNFTRYTANGAEEVKEIKRDEDGTIKENLLIKGNNLLALHSLKEQFAGKVKLIYIDPPYNTGKDSFAYNDKFRRSTWLTFMKNRLEIAKDLLSEDGSIFIQIDYKQSAYLKILLDQVFGEDKFRNEIIWGYRIQGVGTNFYGRKHDTIYYYAKESHKYKAEKEKIIYNSKFIDTKVIEPDVNKITDKEINEINTLLSKRLPLKDKYKEKLFNKYYSEVYVRDVWDGDYTKPFISGSKEYFKFRTQKPEGLLKRIINNASEEGDIVLDFFSGSGTTLSVCKKLNRKFIGIEQMKDTIENITLPRLIKVLEGDSIGISKDVDWRGGGDFIYFELAEYNEEAKNKIDACKSYKELKELFSELTDYYFLNYNVSVQQFNNQLLEDKDFQELPLEEQKTLFKALLDNNQLYIPYKEQEDGKYNLSKEDKELTNEFYGQ